VFKALRERWADYRLAISARASDGAELLDRRIPGWERRVDPRSLHMTDMHRCVLGQVYGGYAEGVRELWPEYWHSMNGATLSHSHGFIVSLFHGPAYFVGQFFLRRAWVAEIDRRRRRPVDEFSLDLADPGVLERCR
jgi:hypothetical protein